MVDVRLVTIGYVNFLTVEKIKNWKSQLFKVVGEIENYPLNADADLGSWGYSDEILEDELLKLDQKISMRSTYKGNIDIYVYVLSVPLEDNYFSRILHGNRILISYYEIREILDSNYVPQENFLISLLYTYVLIFLIKDKSELSMNDEIAMAHTVTRGCLFDMRGIKTDAIEACVAPQICGICIGKLLSSGIPQRDINLVNSELKRIKRIRYYELLLYFQKHPVKSMIIMAIASLLLNVISNLITDIIIHFL